ncbi:MAG: chlorite dismutase family protein [Sphingobacteriales bacterium]
MEKPIEEKIKSKLTSFYGGKSGSWKVVSSDIIAGEPMIVVDKIEMVNPGQVFVNGDSDWVLKGFSSNSRYVTREEKTKLDEIPPVFGKPENSFAAFIPMSKSEEWWLLTQDERRKIFEEQSDHIKFSYDYLTQIPRKLFHSRDIGEEFDFLAWFEFKPESKNLFDDLVGYLRQTEEWKYVTREIDIRVVSDL